LHECRAPSADGTPRLRGRATEHSNIEMLPGLVRGASSQIIWQWPFVSGTIRGVIASCRTYALLIRRAAFVFFVTVLLVGRLCAAESAPDFTKFAVIAPGADLVSAAKARKIPLSGSDSAGEPGVLNPGDSFAAVVTLCEKGGKRTQWLLYLTALADKPKESEKPSEPIVLYSGRSNRFEFASSPAQVRLETIGPFTGTPSKKTKVQQQSETFTLDKGLLSLGLDQAARSVWRAVQANESGHFYFDSQPPNAKQMAEAGRVAEKLQLTVEEERALAGGIPALFSYFDVVQHTEGLEDILLKVVRKPSLWSIIRHIGVTVNLRFELKQITPAAPNSWGSLTSGPLYYVPLAVELNHQLALTVTFAVTNPRPPLLSCGGIIGMLAERPGDKETYLTLRIVSARLAPSPRSDEPKR
jgi:hypothetical protein